MRLSGRNTVRPCLPDGNLPEAFAFQIGIPVDAWWNDGWWEGVIVGVESYDEDKVQVYFPGEDVFLICQKKSLRISKDWVGNRWVDINMKPDILSVLSLFSSGSSSMSDHHFDATNVNLHGEDIKVTSSLSSGNDDSMDETEQENECERDGDEITAEDDRVAIS